VNKRPNYNYHGPKTLAEIIKFTGGELIAAQQAADINSIIITDIKNIEDAASGDLTFISNKKYSNLLVTTEATVCLISEDEDYSQKNPQLSLIKVKNPYYEYSRILTLFYSEKQAPKGFKSPTAVVDIAAQIGEDVTIGHNVVIEAGAIIGDGTIIDSGAVIKQDVVIGKNCRIGASSMIAYARLGDNCIIHSGVRIGNDGFGFATFNGVHNKILHIGCVIIGDKVEIGANSTIDRGSTKDTLIGAGTIIDNLVQIGHNAEIGKNCIIVAQVGIAGSTILEDYCVVGGQAGIAGHLRIGKGAQIAGQTGVISNIEPGQVVGGYPAMPIKDWHRQTILLRKMLNERKNTSS